MRAGLDGKSGSSALDQQPACDVADAVTEEDRIVLARRHDQIPRPHVLDEPAAETALELSEPVPRMLRVPGGRHAPEIDVPAASGMGGSHRGPQCYVHR